MNSGFISYIIIAIVTILILFDWQKLAIGQCSRMAVVAFLLAWIVAVNMNWSITDQIGGSYVYVPLLISIALLQKSWTVQEKLDSFSFALLLGAFHTFIRYIQSLDPFLVLIHPFVDGMLLGCGLILYYTRDLRAQIFILSISFILSDLAWGIIFHKWLMPWVGAEPFQDRWWLYAIMLRFMTISWEMIVAKIRAFCYDEA